MWFQDVNSGQMGDIQMICIGDILNTEKSKFGAIISKWNKLYKMDWENCLPSQDMIYSKIEETIYILMKHNKKWL